MKTDEDVDKKLFSTTPVSLKQKPDMAEITGRDGFWQRRIFLIISFLHIPCAFQFYCMSFLAPNLDHWCARPLEAQNLSMEDWKNLAIPPDNQHCSRYEYTNLTHAFQNRTNISEQAIIPCQAWEYDTAFYHSSLLSQFDLVCDRKWLISLAKSVFIAGMCLSVIVFGHLSDRIGRKPVIIISGFITIFSAFFAAFSTAFLTFLIARFFIASGVTVLMSTPFVLLMEIVAPEYRNRYGIAVPLGWSLGMVTLPLIAWLIRDSFWIQIALTSPCLMLLAVHWIPESPRWLLNHGKDKEAEKLLLAAGKINGVKHTDENKEALRSLMSKGIEVYKSGGSKGNVLDLLRTPGLWQITLNVYFNWFAISFVYYGLSLNTNELAGNPFVNFALSGAVEIPAFLLTIFIVGTVGKKKILIASMVINGFACFTSHLFPVDLWWLTVTISSIGKFAITAAFAIIYVYSNELFPTVVRNSGMGSAALCGKLGTIIAPFMRELGDSTHPIIPQSIFGILAITCGLLVILLPETKNSSVPDTMEEAAQFSRMKNFKMFKEIKENGITVTMTETGEQDANEQDAMTLLATKTTFSV